MLVEKKMILNRLFSERLFHKLVKHPENATYSTIIQRYVNDPEAKNNGELISEIYQFMSREYRNEYYYQNTLLNKLLLGKHSINTTTALKQVPVGKSKADFILINGKAVVYEIKTELDTFERLDNQLRYYYQAFNHVCVVTSESQFEKAYRLLENSPVGIYILTKRGTISSKLRREPVTDNSRLDYSTIFKVLRKKEYEAILEQYYGNLPVTTQVSYYGECLKQFSHIPLDEAYTMVLKQLKKRNRIKIENLDDVPYELCSLVYFTNPNQKEWAAIKSFLNTEYAGVGNYVLPIC